MATTRKPPTESATMDYVRQAMRDLDHARERAGTEVRENLDTAMERLRHAVEEMRDRARTAPDELQERLEGATEEVLVELGRRAIRAQRSPKALTELSGEIRKRKAELTA